MRTVTLIFVCSLAPTAWAEQVHIAVAANFKQTAVAINVLFQATSGHSTTLSSASTGVLHSQISHGAPFDIFLSDDSNSPTGLEASGHSVPGIRFWYARGQLVLAGGDSLDALGNSDLSLAIANPATAPYGRAAMEVLRRPEFTGASERKLVRASNVVQAYQYWHMASVDLGLVAQSLAPGTGVTIPQDWYQPLKQEAVLLRRAHKNQAAKSYMGFLQSDTVRALIENAGYGSCQ